MSSLCRYASIHAHNHLLLFTLYLINSLLEILLLPNYLCNSRTYILCDGLNGSPFLFSLLLSPSPTFDLVWHFYPEFLQLLEYLNSVVSLNSSYFFLHGSETLYHLSPFLLLNLDLTLQCFHLLPQLLLVGLGLCDLAYFFLNHTLLSLMLALQ